MVGNADGVDTSIQEFLFEEGVNNVTVFLNTCARGERRLTKNWLRVEHAAAPPGWRAAVLWSEAHRALRSDQSFRQL